MHCLGSPARNVRQPALAGRPPGRRVPLRSRSAPFALVSCPCTHQHVTGIITVVMAETKRVNRVVIKMARVYSAAHNVLKL